MAEPRVPAELIDEETAALDRRDHDRLSRVESSLARGLELQRWWREKTRGLRREFKRDRLWGKVQEEKLFKQSFPLLQPLPHWGESDVGFGFFDQTRLGASDCPLMGVFHQTVFDDPKLQLLARTEDREEALASWRDEIRSFVLHHLIRLTSIQDFSPWVDPEARSCERWLRPLSWCPPATEQRAGFGFTQLYYKKRASGRIGKFRDADRLAVDLARLDDELEWIVVGARIHDVHLRYPAAPDWLNLSIKDEILAVMSRDTVIDEPTAGDGLKGHFGIGYAFIDDPVKASGAIPWRRPRYGFQMNEFLVKDDGRILGRMLMLSERLPRLLDVNLLASSFRLTDLASLGLLAPLVRWSASLAEKATPGAAKDAVEKIKRLADGERVGPSVDPVSITARVANRISFGYAAKHLCVSKEAVLKSLLTDFARSGVSTLIGARGAWRAVPDWTDEANLPDWARLRPAPR